MKSPSISLLRQKPSSVSLMARRGKNLSGLTDLMKHKMSDLTSANSGFFEKYRVNKNDCKGAGSSASVYSVDSLSPISTNEGTVTRKVVKIVDVNDENVLTACKNEISVLQKLPRHDNIV